MKSYICLDIENNAVPETKYGRKAGNFLFDKIVAVGYKNAMIHKAKYTSDKNLILGLVPNCINVLVGHNLIHDLLFLWESERLQYMLKNGLQIFDTMYAEYLLSGQQKTYKDLALRELAVKKYGCKEREKKMEKYWDEGKLTSEIPKELVLEDVTNDVLDDEQIYLQQVKALEESGMTSLMEGIMDFELATIEMTYNGMFIERELFEKNKKELKLQLDNKEIDFLNAIRKYIDTQNFNIRSSQQIATILFGGEVKKEIVEPVLTDTGEFKYSKKGELKIHKVIVKEQVKGLKLKCPKLTPSGKPSTDDEVLNQLDHQIVKQLLEFRKLDKLHSTYYEGFQELIYPDNRIHPNFNLCSTATGRSSCSNPNTQNQPEQAGKLIKSHFTSRFGQNGTFVKSDFSQIEVCVQAAISNDTKYIQDIINGVDFHIKWVAISENIDYKYVEEKIKKEKDPEWVEKRKRIKPVTFSMNYGASAWMLSKNSGMTEEEIEKIIIGFETEYYQLKQYYNYLKEVLEFTKEPTYIYNRYTNKGWYQSCVGRKYYFIQREDRKGNQYFHKPEYMNYIVQGTMFDIVAIMTGKFWREKAIHNRDKYLMINFVHDEIDFDCKKEYLDFLKKDCELLTDVKEMMQQQFEFNFKVPIKIDLKAGTSWSDCE